MKKIYIIIIASIITLNLIAQNSNLSFYSQQGEKFYIILNGIRQNDIAETNVKVQGLSQPYYKLKVIFEDESKGELDKNLNFNPGMESVFAIKQNKKGRYLCRWQSETPVAQAPPPAANQQVVTYTSTARPPVSNTEVTITETTTNTTSGGAGNVGGENVNMSVNLGGIGLSMNVNVNDNMGGNSSANSSTTTTTTTTYSSTTVQGGAVQSAPPASNGYTGPTGCSGYTMSDADFNSALQSIKSKDFSDTRLTVAKQVTSSNCLLSKQVKQITLLFDFEDGKLDYAKYAYTYTYDINNYYQVNDVFEFESSIEELNNYIKTK